MNPRARSLIATHSSAISFRLTNKDAFLHDLGRRLLLFSFFSLLSGFFFALPNRDDVARQQERRLAYSLAGFGHTSDQQDAQVNVPMTQASVELMFISNIIFVAILGFVYFRISRCDVAYLSHLRRYEPLPSKTHLWREIFSIAKEMSLDMPDVRLIRSDSGMIPSVASDQNGSVLVVPMGFLPMLRSECNSARAVIIHELAHIKERDGWLFTAGNEYSKCLLYILSPAAVVLSLIAIGTNFLSALGVWSILWYLAVFWFFQSGRRTKKEFTEARLQSEVRADCYACVYGHGPALARVFTKYLSNRSAASSLHPAPRDRAEHVHSSLEYLSMNAPLITEEQAAILGKRKKRRHPWRPGSS